MTQADVHILLVEDNEADVELALHALRMSRRLMAPSPPSGSTSRRYRRKKRFASWKKRWPRAGGSRACSGNLEI